MNANHQSRTTKYQEHHRCMLVSRPGSKCRAWGFGGQGAGCRVTDAGCEVQGAGCRVQGVGCMAVSQQVTRSRHLDHPIGNANYQIRIAPYQLCTTYQKLRNANHQICNRDPSRTSSPHARKSYLTECMNLLVFKSQLPHQIVNLLFTMCNQNVMLTVVWGR